MRPLPPPNLMPTPAQQARSLAHLLTSRRVWRCPTNTPELPHFVRWSHDSQQNGHIYPAEIRLVAGLLLPALSWSVIRRDSGGYCRRFRIGDDLFQFGCIVSIGGISTDEA